MTNDHWQENNFKILAALTKWDNQSYLRYDDSSTYLFLNLLSQIKISLYDNF